MALAVATPASRTHGVCDVEVADVDGVEVALRRAGEAGAGAEVVGVCSSGYARHSSSGFCGGRRSAWAPGTTTPPTTHSITPRTPTRRRILVDSSTPLSRSMVFPPGRPIAAKRYIPGDERS
jgi:hypothetical protein